MVSPATAASAKPKSATIASTMVKTNSISAFGIMGKPDKTTIITPLGAFEGARGLKDYQTDRCLDSNAAGQVYTNPCQFPGNLYQNWDLWQYDLMTPGGVPYSVWAWQDVATGRCLDSNAAGNLYTNPCQAPGNDYQTWVGGVISNEIVDEHTGLCLDSNYAGQAYTHVCNGGNFQAWIQV
jgi:serine/threonine-protein kinase